MDGAGIASVLALGAEAAQLGTAFIACPESNADDDYRALLASPAAFATEFTNVISGRSARGLPNGFSALAHAELRNHLPPDYPFAYDAGKALIAAARAAGDGTFGAHWAGQGAPLVRSLPIADLIAELERELLAVAPQGVKILSSRA
jgi:nitronate monooxygenase